MHGFTILTIFEYDVLNKRYIEDIPMDPKMYAIALIFASGFEIAKFTKVRLIKTHSHVSAAKKAMWCTSVLLTGTPNLPFSTRRISMTIGPWPISINYTYFMHSIYVTLHTKFEENWPSS